MCAWCDSNTHAIFQAIVSKTIEATITPQTHFFVGMSRFELEIDPPKRPVLPLQHIPLVLNLFETALSSIPNIRNQHSQKIR